MLTPDFELKQTEEFIVVVIRCPYIKVSEVEFFISGSEFKFVGKPYFLSLSLPGEIVDDDRATSKYDVDKGEIVAFLPKKVTGEHFKDLGMITKLLSPKSNTESPAAKKYVTPQIEVLSTSCIQENSNEDFDWWRSQGSPISPSKMGEEKLLFEVRYGFAGKYSNVFEKLQREIPNIVDVPSPDHMTARERHEARCLCEDNSFSPDHYLADLMDNVYLEEAILTYKPHWQKELAKFRKQSKVKVEPLSVCCSTDPVKNKSDILEPNAEIIPFTPKHLALLKQLPKKEYLLDSEIKREVYLGLVDIMLAYVYNHITCEGENNIESAWTICKLSASLSWLQVFRADLKEVVVTFFRRSLSFPLYRHWSLSQFVLNETRDLFLLGRRKLLVCLLEIHHLFSLSDHFYVLNDIFITDYCVWIQYASSEAIASISEALGKCTVSREEIPWELLELEQAAQLVADEASSDD